MPLVTSKEMLLKAQQGGYAVGAFNAENMEMVKAIIQAAEELKAPVMIQTTPSTIKYGTLETYQAIVAAEAAKASVPVCLHLDHGSSFDLAMKALKAGYTSVMIDGSKLDYEGNIEEIKPYLNLSEMLGKIYYQTEKSPVKRIEITYSGDLADDEVSTGLYTLSVVKGFLEPIISSRVNYVNAKVQLDSMGVELIESKSSQLEKYTNLISVKFVTRDKSLNVSGTVFAKSELRIVDFFGYKLDFEPTENVLAIQNRDVPGMVGKIGSVLGNQGINIAAMQWSRKIRGDKAEAFVSVDQAVSEAVLEELRRIDGVQKVSQIKFW